MVGSVHFVSSSHCCVRDQVYTILEYDVEYVEYPGGYGDLRWNCVFASMHFVTFIGFILS